MAHSPSVRTKPNEYLPLVELYPLLTNQENIPVEEGKIYDAVIKIIDESDGRNDGQLSFLFSQIENSKLENILIHSKNNSFQKNIWNGIEEIKRKSTEAKEEFKILTTPSNPDEEAFKKIQELQDSILRPEKKYRTVELLNKYLGEKNSPQLQHNYSMLETIYKKEGFNGLMTFCENLSFQSRKTLFDSVLFLPKKVLVTRDAFFELRLVLRFFYSDNKVVLPSYVPDSITNEHTTSIGIFLHDCIEYVKHVFVEDPFQKVATFIEEIIEKNRPCISRIDAEVLAILLEAFFEFQIDLKPVSLINPHSSLKEAKIFYQGEKGKLQPSLDLISDDDELKIDPDTPFLFNTLLSTLFYYIPENIVLKEVILHHFLPSITFSPAGINKPTLYFPSWTDHWPTTMAAVIHEVGHAWHYYIIFQKEPEDDFIESQYESAFEYSSLYEISDAVLINDSPFGGHPWDNHREFFASLFLAYIIAPEKLIEAIQTQSISWNAREKYRNMWCYFRDYLFEGKIFTRDQIDPFKSYSVDPYKDE